MRSKVPGKSNLIKIANVAENVIENAIENAIVNFIVKFIEMKKETVVGIEIPAAVSFGSIRLFVNSWGVWGGGS